MGILAASAALSLSAAEARARVAVEGTPAATARIGAILAGSKMPLPDVRIVVAPCPGFPDVAGCTATVDPVAPVYIAPGNVDWYTVLHELGHRFAAQLPPGAVHRFGTLTGRRRVAVTDERLADAYAMCARGVTSRDPRRDMNWPSGYGYYPRPGVHRRVCGMLRRAAPAV